MPARPAGQDRGGRLEQTLWLPILHCLPGSSPSAQRDGQGWGPDLLTPTGPSTGAGIPRCHPPPVTGRKGSDFPELGGNTLQPGLSTPPCVTFTSHYGHAGWPGQVGVGWVNLRHAGCLVPSQLPAGEAFSHHSVTRSTTAEPPPCSRLRSRRW